MKTYIPVVLLFCLNTAYAADVVKTIPAQRLLSSDGGRFVYGQVSDARRDQYMLDTKTGRLWQIVEYTFSKKPDGSPGRTVTTLQPVLYMDKNESTSVEPIPEK